MDYNLILPRFENKMKNILIIGLGGMGRRHIKVFSEMNNIRIYCFDIDSKRLQNIQDEFSSITCFTNLEDLPLADIHGAVIVTPTHTHIEFAEWCINRNIPFLLEKPISNNLDRVTELIQKAKEKKIIAGVAYPRRNSEAVKKIKKMLNEGFIGDLQMILSNFSQDFRKYRPDYQQTYYAKLSTGGGLLLDALTHHVDLVTYFAGPIKSVYALANRQVFEGCEGEDTAVLSLHFQNGIIGNMVGNQFQKPNMDQIELVGTAGNIRYERVTGILAWNKSDSPTWTEEWIDGDWEKILSNQADNFLHALATESVSSTIPTSLKDARHSLEVVIAAKKSAIEGKSIEI